MVQMSLELVVVAIVILVVALVVLTIFGGGISPFANMSNPRSTCANAGKSSCEAAMGTKPATWDLNNIKKADNSFTSCNVLVDVWTNCCKQTPPSTGQPTTYAWSC
jgi:hypothetical protein